MTSQPEQFNKNEVERLTFLPLVDGQPKVHCLLVRADVSRSREGKTAQVPLLVDTGATYTILPASFLNGLGYDLQNPIDFYKSLRHRSRYD